VPEGRCCEPIGRPLSGSPSRPGDDVVVDEVGGEAPASSEFVRSFDRGLAIIAAFDADHSELTLSDAARRAGVTRAAARRLLLTLVQLGYVRSEGRYFSLRPKVLELGYAYLSALSLPQIAMPYLKQLASTVHESAYLSVLDGRETVCVADAPIRRIWTASIGVGTRFPAFVTAAGRVILASQEEVWVDGFLTSADLTAITPYTTVDRDELKGKLSTIREQGWALVDHELEEGLRTTAVPVHGQSGVVAAVSFSTMATATNVEAVKAEMLPPLLAAARSIERDVRDMQRVGLSA
jgi:IclR family pca regulon transcriptional regulator